VNRKKSAILADEMIFSLERQPVFQCQVDRAGIQWIRLSIGMMVMPDPVAIAAKQFLGSITKHFGSSRVYKRMLPFCIQAKDSFDGGIEDGPEQLPGCAFILRALLVPWFGMQQLPGAFRWNSEAPEPDACFMFVHWFAYEIVCTSIHGLLQQDLVRVSVHQQKDGATPEPFVVPDICHLRGERGTDKGSIDDHQGWNCRASLFHGCSQGRNFMDTDLFSGEQLFQNGAEEILFSVMHCQYSHLLLRSYLFAR
jgi:hypothetical protein